VAKFGCALWSLKQVIHHKFKNTPVDLHKSMSHSLNKWCYSSGKYFSGDLVQLFYMYAIEVLSDE